MALCVNQASAPPDAAQFDLHGAARLRIKRAPNGSSISRIRGSLASARDLQALLHAAGQLGRVLAFLTVQGDQLEILHRTVAPLAPVHAAQAQASQG
jgi:hypothetical protein